VALALASLAAGAGANAEPNICPPRQVGPNEPEELLMHESDFSLEKARESVSFLRNDFAKRIWGEQRVQDFSSSSAHYISYMNSLRFIEGALLREEALHLRAHSELLAKTNPDSAEAKVASDAFLQAKAKFCDFINNSIYVD
jgi:hypothetical protein